MQTIIKNIVWICLLAVPFIALYVASGHPLDIPNVGSSGLYFPFISGKNLFFRVLVGIAFFGWVILALKDVKYRLVIKKSPILIAYGLFMAVLLVADLFGVDPFRSFWSNFERMEGFVAHMFLFGYFVTLSAMLQTAAEYGKMFKAFVISNILVLIFGFGQLLGAPGYFFSEHFPKVAAFFSGAFPIHMSENRLDATLGNSAYFAIYCLMFIFILALMWSQGQVSRFRNWYPVLIFLNLVALFYTGTRGAQIGLLVGGFITLSLVGWFEKGHARKAIVGVLVGAVILVGSIFVFKESSFIQSSPTLARFASISPNDLTGMSRLSIWKISYEAWKERPLLGYGQENFSYIFAGKFLPEKMWMLESWYDRSHDVFFDWLVATGIVGLLAYLSLYGVALYLMWMRKSDMPFKERAILTGALAGYFVHNIFVFDNLISYIMFFFLLAYIGFRTNARGEGAHGKTASDDQMNMLWLPVIGVLTLATLYMFVYRPFMVNKLMVKGLDVNRLVQTMTVVDAIKVQRASFEKAIAMNTLGTMEAREQYLQTAIRMTQISVPNDIAPSDRQAAIQAMSALIQGARKEIENSYEANKNDVRMLSIYGMFYNGIQDGVSGERVLLRAHELAPKKQLVSFDLARSYMLQGKFNDAYTLARETYDLAPAYQDAAKIYLLTSVYAKKWQEARNYIESKGQSIAFDADILSALVETNQRALAIELLNELKRENPQYAAEVDAYIKELLAK